MNDICKDCGLVLTDAAISHAEDPYTLDHKGFCCDCYDQQWGMPDEARSVPRPKKE